MGEISKEPLRKPIKDVILFALGPAGLSRFSEIARLGTKHIQLLHYNDSRRSVAPVMTRMVGAQGERRFVRADAGIANASQSKAHVNNSPARGRQGFRSMRMTEEKSRHEIITRAKISYGEQKTNMSMRAWIDRELREIGLPAITDDECKQYALASLPRIF